MVTAFFAAYTIWTFAMYDFANHDCCHLQNFHYFFLFPKRNSHISFQFGNAMFAERKCFLRKVLDFRKKAKGERSL